jgi:hypothetical protein
MDFDKTFFLMIINFDRIIQAVNLVYHLENQNSTIPIEFS